MTYALTLPDGMDLRQMAESFVRSGYFGERNACAIVTKVLMGAELGLMPATAMQSITVIKGKPTLSAHLIASKIDGHPDYDYVVKEHTDKVCTIEFFKKGKSKGEHTYTIEMARKAGLMGSNTWQKYPKAMLFARCISSGYRTRVPGALAMRVYTAEELGGKEGKDDAVEVEATIVEAVPAPSEPTKVVEAEVMEEPKPAPKKKAKKKRATRKKKAEPTERMEATHAAMDTDDGTDAQGELDW